MKIESCCFMKKGYAQKEHNHLMIRTQHPVILDSELVDLKLWLLCCQDTEFSYFDISISMYMCESGQRKLAINVYWEVEG